MTEFLIHERWQEGDTTFVSGVVDEGIVKIGSVFNILKRGPARNPEDETNSPICLTVTQIVSYGRNFDDLHRGTTGALAIKGSGANQLYHGDFILSTQHSS